MLRVVYYSAQLTGARYQGRKIAEVANKLFG
jgi:hypothetical protein